MYLLEGWGLGRAFGGYLGCMLLKVCFGGLGPEGCAVAYMQRSEQVTRRDDQYSVDRSPKAITCYQNFVFGLG